MSIIKKIKLLFKGNVTEFDPEKGYDIWAHSYDDQPDNLMLALDEELFNNLLSSLPINGKVIVDIGCGTGRHWKKIFDHAPKQLIGYDVSEGMVKMLHQKFPDSVVHHLVSNTLFDTPDNYCDIIISTLTMAHIEDAKGAIQEWNRVLKPGGYAIITDYHPEVLKKGGKRTFKEKGKTIGVKNNIHTIDDLQVVARQLQWQQLRFIERKIDDTLKPFYEKQNAIAVYESFKGMPVIYGMLFKKEDGTE